MTTNLPDGPLNAAMAGKVMAHRLNSTMDQRLQLSPQPTQNKVQFPAQQTAMNICLEIPHAI